MASNTNAARKPPEHLSNESKKIWNDALNQYELTASDLGLLRVALENKDLGDSARADLRKRGNVLPTPNGFKTNPSLMAAKGHDVLYLAAMKHLGLDIEEGPSERADG